VQALNTGAQDLMGWVSPDGCRVYFASNNAAGVGESDIYVAERP
jgi:hypothetical protein